jgi:type 1 glutamine amidotransferase
VDHTEKLLEVLVVTGGHPFQAEPFFAAFSADSGLVWAHAPQPSARAWLGAPAIGRWDAIVFYDMPGVGLREGALPETVSPPPELVDGMGRLLDSGQGIVFLHHAIASWPGWDEYAHWVGGRFLYRPGRLAGRDWPDSGYLLDVTHTITPATSGHPVLAGLDAGLTLTDELYLAPVLENEVVPLLRSDATFTDDRFWSAAAAVQGRRDSREGWSHPAGSDLVAWAKRSRRSPVVYLQPGDGPSAYGDPGWRRLLGNAIRWVASDEAHVWASS